MTEIYFKIYGFMVIIYTLNKIIKNKNLTLNEYIKKEKNKLEYIENFFNKKAIYGLSIITFLFDLFIMVNINYLVKSLIIDLLIIGYCLLSSIQIYILLKKVDFKYFVYTDLCINVINFYIALKILIL